MSGQSAKPIAVLFDMDGVITLSNHAHQIAWEEFGRSRLGVPITKEMFFRSISGRKNEEAIADLFPGRFSPAELTQIGAQKEAFFRAKFGSKLEAVPGVLRLIRELSSAPACACAAIAVASSAPLANVEFVLERFGVKNAFKVVVNGDEVEKAKPDPAIYQLAAQRCGMAPEQCVVLEDAVAGVQAAKRAGMCCLAVTTSTSAAMLQEAGADMIAADFTNVTLATLQSLVS